MCFTSKYFSKIDSLDFMLSVQCRRNNQSYFVLWLQKCHKKSISKSFFNLFTRLVNHSFERTFSVKYEIIFYFRQRIYRRKQKQFNSSKLSYRRKKEKATWTYSFHNGVWFALSRWWTIGRTYFNSNIYAQKYLQQILTQFINDNK